MKLLLFILLSSITAVSAQLCHPNTNSLRFDGNSYVSFPPNTNLDIAADITVEAWIKPTAFAPNYVQGSIVCKHGWSQGEKGYVLRAGGNGILAFAIAGLDNHGSPAGWKEVTSNAGDLQLNTWHHVAGTYDGHKIKLYIDGNQVASKNFMGSINPSSCYNLKIGRIADDSTFDKRFFTGLIDEVRIWKTALARTTLETNMTQQISGSSTDLVAYWQMNDGTGNNVTDIGPSSCNGTLISANWDTDVPFTNGVPRPVITVLGNTLVSSVVTGNQWNLDGVPIPGETGMTITPAIAGQYTVTALYGLGCSATSEPYDFVFAAIGELTQGFSLVRTSPGIYRLNLNGESVKDFFVSVFDINGRKVFSNTDAFAPIDLSDKRGGIYLMLLSLNGKAMKVKLFLE